MYITKCIVLFKRTKNFGYLLKAIFLIFQQQRFLEVVWSLFCFVRFRPSLIVVSEEKHELVNRAISHAHKLYPYNYSRAQLIQMFGEDYAVSSLPCDFEGSRSESIVLTKWGLIIGEYAKNSASIALVNKESCYSNQE